MKVSSSSKITYQKFETNPKINSGVHEQITFAAIDLVKTI